MDNFMTDVGAGYASDGDEIGLTTAVEQTTGSKQSMFRGFGRNVSVSTYQWVIVVGAVAALWALGYSLRSEFKLGG